MRVLVVVTQQIRRYGKTGVCCNLVTKLINGLVKNNHNVYVFSDRDIASFNAPFRIRELGHKKANKYFLEVVLNYRPDLIILGSGKIISNETILRAKALLKTTPVVLWNVDGIFIQKNIEYIIHRSNVVDMIYITTSRLELTKISNIKADCFFIPNPVDLSIETCDASEKCEFENDLIFCSYKNVNTHRLNTIEYLRSNIDPKINFHVRGINKVPPLWGRRYVEFLSTSKMGLCLNHQEGVHLYASDRMAQLIGNGILTFLHSNSGFQGILPDETVIYFKNQENLKNSIHDFFYDDEKRKAWAKKARTYYFKKFETKYISQYIIENTFDMSFSNDYLWHLM